ncbi:MAG: hypothetical protein SPE85_08610 [Prevotella sp.]|nr:hypothetical protein [Prevotella sp.]
METYHDTSLTDGRRPCHAISLRHVTARRGGRPDKRAECHDKSNNNRIP